MNERVNSKGKKTCGHGHCSTIRSFHQTINRTVSTINSIIAVCVILCEQVPRLFMFREKKNDMFLAVAGNLGQAALFSMSTR